MIQCGAFPPSIPFQRGGRHHLSSGVGGSVGGRGDRVSLGGTYKVLSPGRITYFFLPGIQIRSASPGNNASTGSGFNHFSSCG